MLSIAQPTPRIDAHLTGDGGRRIAYAEWGASEGAPVSLAMLEYIHLHKTTRLLEAAAVCGAIVGGGTDREIESVRRISSRAGSEKKTIR